MTRPILWAVTTFAAIGVAASLAGERMSRLARPGAAASGREVPAAPTGGRAEASGGTVTVHGDVRGHFTVEAAVDGRRLAMMIDTGATIVALSHEDALAAGIRPFPADFTRTISTANGIVAVAPVRIRELRVGAIAVRDVEAVVVPQGRLRTSLLGMSFLRRLRGFDIADNRLTLRG